MKIFIIDMKKPNLIFIFLGIVAIVIVWELSSVFVNNSLIIPKINDVLYSLKNILSSWYSYLIIFKTILRLIITVITSFIISLLFAFLSYLSSKFESFIKPIITIIKTVPVASIIIILLLMLGNKLSPYVITSFVILPIMYESILSSFKQIDENIIDEIKMIDKFNFQVIYSVFIPIVFPSIITAIIQSFGLGLKVMIMAEFIAQPKNTIGYILYQERAYYFNTANVFAWTIILIFFVMVVEILIKAIKTKYN